MRPVNLCLGSPRSIIPGLAIGGIGLGSGVLALLLGGCATPSTSNATLPQRFGEIACIEECRLAKDGCDEDARYDYRQCQAGYGTAFRNYRWCLASAHDTKECGYPWWSCAENLYGYCSNRYQECVQSCRKGG